MRRNYWIIGGIALALVVLVVVGLALLFILNPPSLPAFLTRPTPSPEELLSELEPLRPLVADRLPQAGVELATDSAMVIFFDQPMDQIATINAFSIDPPVAGSFLWLDADTLQFTPSEPLERAAKYTVTISGEAQSVEGQTVEGSTELIFQTVGFLEVSQVVPAPDATGVEPLSVITVMFNRPVVPLVIAEEQAGLPQPLALDPPVAGAGEWLNTSIYQFTPDQSLAGGQTYRARVAGGLEDTTGGLMVEDYEWEFVTLPPSVLEVSPEAEAVDVALDEEIRITFNQPMDLASVQSALTVEADGRPVSGQFAWDEEDENTLIFTPSPLLALNTRYAVRLAQSARSVSGEVGLDRSYDWEFRTVFAPAIVSVAPTHGETRADPDQRFRIRFASPMDEDTLEDKVLITPAPPEDTESFYSEYDRTLTFYFALQPSTDYTVQILPGMADPYGNIIDRTQIVEFTTNQAQPQIWLNAPGQVGLYDSANETELFAVFRNVDTLDFNLYSMSLDTFALLTGPDGYQYREEFDPPRDDLLRSWSISVEGELNEFIFIKQPVADEGGGSLPPGVYLLEMDAPNVDKRFFTRHIMVVASANLTFKSAYDEGLVWLTDLRSGQPISGKQVQFYDSDFFASAQGQTDADGLAHVDLPPVPYLSTVRYAVVDDGDTFAVAYTNWDEGLQGYQFGVPTSYAAPTSTAYLYTDRPLYRPGQPVSFKGIVRNVDDVTYTLPGVQQVPVRIYNTQGDLIYQEALPVSEFGTFTGQFTLDEEATLGFNRIEADVGAETTGLGFQVAEYRKPEFQVTLTPAEPEVAQGDTIRVEGQATFFFGGPVSDADVEWTAVRGSYFFDYSGPGRWRFSDLNVDEGPVEAEFVPGFGRVVTEGTATTDGQGQFIIELPADLGEQVTSGSLTIEAVVTDTEDQTVANRTQVVIHAGDFYVGLQPERYIGEANKEQMVNIITVDWDGEPVEQQDLSVEVVERNWSCAREEDEFGRRVWTCDVEELPVDSLEVTTDRQGRASATFTPPGGGTYRVRAVGRDDGGRQVSASAFVWVSGAEFVSWRQQNNDRIELVADRDSYAPGDTAEVLITSPFQGEVQALITVERGGILTQEVITLTSNSTVYRVPITGDLAPNVYVSAVLVKGVDATSPVASFKMGLVELEVEPTEQTITVEVTPDSEKVGPGDEVSYDIRTTDHTGDPVSAEVSLALADLAALSLAEPNSGAILDHFYGNAALGVRTSLALTLSVDRLNQELFDLGKGGGGGGDEAFFEVRGEFRDTAYWRADVVTDDQGRASVTITLPDNLTTWRMDARAVTLDTLVGDTTVDIVSTKDLLVRPVTPRFLVVGDEVRLGAIVHNNTDGDINNVRIELAAEGVELSEGSEVRQRMDIGAGERVEVFWNVTALDVENVDLVFSAQGGGLSDASKPTLGIPPDQLLPVYRFEAPETVGTAGTLDEATTRVEAIVLPRTFEVTQGELAIELDPSLAASMTDGLDYLEHFTYECTEQTVSRFLPNVLTVRAMQELGLEDPELEADLDAVVNQGLQRLYSQQHVDGGWGWWVQDRSSATVSAWVVLGMVEAQNTGYPVSPDALERGIEFLRGDLQPLDSLDKTTDLNRQAFILYVLAKADRADVSRTNQLYEARQSLDHYARAYLAQTLWIIDPADARINNILSDLNNAAVASATGVHWEEDNLDYWNWNTDTRSTAIILDTFALIDPDNALNPNVVRWLMVARSGGHWETTQETAWSLIALTDWMTATGELDTDYDFDVALNGQELVSGVANQNTLREPTTLEAEIGQLSRTQANQLAITRGDGPGILYYTAHLTVGLPVEEIESLSRGIIVSRQYYLADDPNRPIDSAQVGDEIRVKLNIIAPYNLHYVVIEDALPAGTEAVDTSLLTTSILDERPELDATDPLRRGWGWWYFSHTQLRDEKVVLSASFLPAGTYEYTYTLRAGLPGEYRVIPPVGYEFYLPEVYGRGEGSLFTITE
jgi:uncharacterized protein YfaS (alpha-2-macroglobulin family)